MCIHVSAVCMHIKHKTKIEMTRETGNLNLKHASDVVIGRGRGADKQDEERDDHQDQIRQGPFQNGTADKVLSLVMCDVVWSGLVSSCAVLPSPPPLPPPPTPLIHPLTPFPLHVCLSFLSVHHAILNLNVFILRPSSHLCK